MKNLGSKIVFLLLIGIETIYAGVVATVDSTEIVRGDTVTLNLTLVGSDVGRPDIVKICDTPILSTSSQTSIRMINGDYKKNYILSYQFSPQKSCKIDSIDVKIDGKIEHSNPIDIIVKKYQKNVNDDFELTLKTDKKEIYVGEPFHLSLIFKQRNGAEAVDSKFIQPDFKGFWMKGESKPKQYKKGQFTYTIISYYLAPQRAGKLEIEPAQMKIATRVKDRNSWGSWVLDVKWKSYFSNDLKIDVLALPQGVSLVGDFTIDATVDKREIEKNEAVNVEIQVNGKGNLEDIETFKPKIVGVSVFDEKISINGDKLTQKIALVADKDFTIPSFELKYFDLKTHSVKTISTKKVDIKVNGQISEKLVVKRDINRTQTVVQPAIKVVQSPTSLDISTIFASVIFVFGLIIGIVIGLFKPWSLIKIEKQNSLKDLKFLIIKLMPFQDDIDVSNLLEQLEKNIYSKEKIEIDKKLLKEVLKRYKV